MPTALIPHSDDYPPLGSLDPDAVTLGRLIEPEYGITNKIRTDAAKHILVFGPNGKGKGTRILIPNLLQMHGNRSIVVVDGKGGENAAVTLPYRRTVSRCIVINPFNAIRSEFSGFDDLKSVGFNPLASIDPALPSFNVRAAELADALVTIEGKDPHWTNSARALTSALLMYTVIEAREHGQVPKMSRFRKLLCEMSEGPRPSNDYKAKGLPKRAAEMMKTSFVGLRHKAAQFSDWNTEIQGIVSTARIQTEPFDDVEIADDMDKNGFDFRELRREPTTVYLILPPDMMERQSKWLRLVLTSAIRSVMKIRRANESRVLFMLDEFFALGHLQIISTVWALVRGYGISMMPVLQDLGQLKRLYPDMWETFIGMAGSVVYFAPNDLTTAEYMSRRAGDTTRNAVSKSSTFSHSKGTNTGNSMPVATGGFGSVNNGLNEGTSYSSNTSTNPVKVPSMAAHEFFGLHEGSVMITLDGLSSVVPAYAPAYYQIRQCRERARDNPYFTG